MQRPIGNAASGDSLGQIEEPETGTLSHAGMAMRTCYVKSEKDSLALLYQHQGPYCPLSPPWSRELDKYKSVCMFVA